MSVQSLDEEGMYDKEEEGMYNEEEDEVPHVFNMHPNGARSADLVLFCPSQHSHFHIILILLLTHFKTFQMLLFRR